MAHTKEIWAVDEQFSNASSSNDSETSFFEFWPMWLIYLPVAFQWVFLSLKYRSVTLPFGANPKVTMAGMVGMPKSELFSQADETLNAHILPWLIHSKTHRSTAEQAAAIIDEAASAGISLPFVCKPDIGCRGVGVKRVSSQDELESILQAYPEGARLLIQRLANHEPEAGIFFVKNPETGEVSIPSMTFKFTPSVTGNGRNTVGELVEMDARAGQLIHLYKERLTDRWDYVPKPAEQIKLVFSASHSKGAIFKDARQYITPALTKSLGRLMEGLPEFYYGRLDVKFPDIDTLQLGKGLEIVEINGASSESIHIWDKNTRLGEAIKQLLWQYRTLFEIGASHRMRGIQPPSLNQFIECLRTERRLTRSYPTTD